MQRIANSSRHSFVSGHFRNLSVGCHTSFGNFLHRFINSLGRAVRNQIIAFRYHPLHLFIRDGTIQNNGIPVFLVLMISRNHCSIGVSPKVSPFRIHFHIQIDISVPFICPKKGFSASLHSDQLPVGVMKGCFLISLRKGQTIL